MLDFSPASFEIPENVAELRRDIRSFLRENLREGASTAHTNSWMVPDIDFSRKLGAAGFIGMTWPREYGGHERSPFERYVVIEELLVAGAPLGAHWIADRQTAPLLLKLGSERQRRKYLPAMARGELYSCIGLSEPGAGSDLASLRTSARRVDGGWQIRGQKVWTTNAHHASVMLTLVRSQAGSQRGEGLSQFLIDLDLPGITVKPIIDMVGNHDFNEVYLDDVVVPDDALLGVEGEGWQQANAELALERSGPERYLSSHLLLNGLIDTLRLRPDPALERLVGDFVSDLYTLRLMSMAVAAKFSHGENTMAESAVVKELGNTFEQNLPNLIQGALPDDSESSVGGELSAMLAMLLQTSLSFSLRGGTREIIQGIIARDLGLR